MALCALHNSIREYAASDLAVRNPFPGDKSITLGRLPEKSHLQPTEEKDLAKDEEGLTLSEDQGRDDSPSSRAGSGHVGRLPGLHISSLPRDITQKCMIELNMAAVCHIPADHSHIPYSPSPLTPPPAHFLLSLSRSPIS